MSPHTQPCFLLNAVHNRQYFFHHFSHLPVPSTAYPLLNGRRDGPARLVAADVARLTGQGLQQYEVGDAARAASCDVTFRARVGGASDG